MKRSRGRGKIMWKRRGKGVGVGWRLCALWNTRYCVNYIDA